MSIINRAEFELRAMFRRVDIDLCSLILYTGRKTNVFGVIIKITKLHNVRDYKCT